MHYFAQYPGMINFLIHIHDITEIKQWQYQIKARELVALFHYLDETRDRVS